MGAFMIWDAYMPGVTSIKGYRSFFAGAKNLDSRLIKLLRALR
jgi:hypothetical protein